MKNNNKKNEENEFAINDENNSEEKNTATSTANNSAKEEKFFGDEISSHQQTCVSFLSPEKFFPIFVPVLEKSQLFNSFSFSNDSEDSSTINSIQVIYFLHLMIFDCYSLLFF